MSIPKARNSGFAISQIEFLILAALAGDKKYGYLIAKEVFELTEGRVKLSAATLYENLSRMLNTGLIEKVGEEEIELGERRKLYRISGEGALVLSDHWRLIERAGALVPVPVSGVSVAPQALCGE